MVEHMRCSWHECGIDWTNIVRCWPDNRMGPANEYTATGSKYYADGAGILGTQNSSYKLSGGWHRPEVYRW